MGIFLFIASVCSMLAAGGLFFLALLTHAIVRETEAGLFVVIAAIFFSAAAIIDAIEKRK